MRFLSSPIEMRGEGKVESIVIGRNELERDESGRVRAVDTGEREEIECGIVFRSIGYMGVGLEGLPFDERAGTSPTITGRVRLRGRAGPRPLRSRLDQARAERRDRHEQEGRSGHGQRAVRGPGWRAHPRALRRHRRRDVRALVAERNPDFVSFGGWRAIDTEEVGRGEPLGRPRVKFCSIEEMVEAARSGDAVSS